MYGAIYSEGMRFKMFHSKFFYKTMVKIMLRGYCQQMQWYLRNEATFHVE